MGMADVRFSGVIETAHGQLDLSGRTLVMGILNVTPDSFSDAGRFAGAEAAVAQAERMLAEGADILDIGGESTRPGAQEVPASEQVRRIVPVIERVRAGHPAAILSVDTRSAAVAEAGLEAGADIINDVSALEYDPAMAEVVARHRVPVILMHMKGTPETMLQEAQYGDVVAEVIEHLRRRVAALEAAGIERGRMIIDPGVGFAKNTFHNLEVLRRVGEFHGLGLPVMVGPSRKRFIGNVLGVEDAEQRLYGTLAAVTVCAQAGVQIVRVHNVGPARQVAEVMEAIRRPERYQ
jgi:dihydropteroate synthase